MKTTLKYLTIVALTIVALTWPSFKVSSTEEEAGVDISEKAEDVMAREAYRHLQLQDENGQIPPDGWSNAYKQKEEMPFLPEAWSEFSSPAQVNAVPGGVWTSIGPGNIGGRIRSIIIHPTNPTIIWAGAVAGGVWKSTDAGHSWSTNTDLLANLAVTSMAIDPTDPNILYAGTGEGFGNIDAVPGNGIFKTVNGGTSWDPVQSTTGNPHFTWVNRLAICPTNSQILLAATKIQPQSAPAYGEILRSTDGGDNWTTCLFLSAPMTDVRFKPNNGLAEQVISGVPAINCIASSYDGRVYYSSDTGATWTLTNGLPEPDSLQRIELAYARSEPSVVYASIARTPTNPDRLYRSDDGGYSFTSAGPSPSSSGLPGANWYTNVLWVDPIDSNTVLVGGVFLLRSRDGGAHWEEAGNTGMDHLDHHVIVEDPGYGGAESNNKIVYSGNDGGIHWTTNILASAPPAPSVNWAALNHSLGVTQFYGAAGHVASGVIIGGTQDNGTVRLRPPPFGPEDWDNMALGDGGFCAVDQTDHPYFYGEYINLTIYRSTNCGAKAQYIYGGPNGIPHPSLCGGVPCANFTAPFVIDPNPYQENTILAGGISLWRTTNARTAQPLLVFWEEIKQPRPDGDYLNAVAVAQGDSNLIWVGYNNGSISYTTNGTAGPSPMPSWLPGDPNNIVPHGKGHPCTRITIAPPLPTDDPQAVRLVYVTFGGFNNNNVWRRESDGITWTNIHHNLPSIPIYSLVVSTSNPAFLYVGTEAGVFASADGGTTWSPNFGGPANTRVVELFWMGTKLVAATHGRGMFTLGPADQ
jgi:photosystem II stability/assembly factor-like uncharacterized protein